MSDSSDPHIKTNGFDREELQEYLDEIAVEDDALLSERGKYMAACKPHRNNIKAVLVRVREAGIKPKAFREVLEKARDDRKRQARIDALEADDRDAYEMLLQSLGEFADTPLGRATLERARPQQDGGDTLDELHQS